MKKYTIFLICCILIATFLGISVNATNDINPLWDNVESISIQLSFDGNNGKATAVTFNQPGVTFSEGILAVYEKQNEDW